MQFDLFEANLQLNGVKVVTELKGLVYDNVFANPSEKDRSQFPVSHANKEELVHGGHAFDVVVHVRVVELKTRGALARVHQHAVT